MASIVLGSIGSALGSATGLPFASALGARLGQVLGGGLDGGVFGSKRTLKPLNGPRLADLGVQSSTYGKMIPIIYGTVRTAGNIIWSQPIRETVTTTTSSAGAGGKGGGGKVSQTTTTYSYSITLAIGICEGPINQVLRIWADARQLDLSQYTLRIYKGDEDQLPDSLISALEGSENTPAFRGLAYVVFEDFPMADYGNRIPNFTFEVQKKALSPDYNNERLEDMITGMVMIPGAGEFVYDTQAQTKIPGAQVGPSWVQQGNQQSINQHTPYGVTNAVAALDQLEDTCPNVEWVSVVVSWFGTAMNAGSCVVLPGVEYQSGAITSPGTWQVGGFNRSSAHQITLVDGSPQYGGTPDDAGIVRYLDELKARGYKIIFYPMMFMDVTDKPWRGDLTGSAGDVASFFTKTNGFNAFITHYAHLVADKVDAFIIGSELKGLTKVSDAPGSYPAVDELVALAASVKAIVGVDVKVTYAADWSEYHHTDGGWYNLDPLWASPDIDMIGIDAYFPLTDAPQNGYDIAAIIDGWTSGEGYDWYYSDPERTIQAPLSAPYAWKNLDWFWSNTHTNPDSSSTDWIPESKPIWFTEYGYPSVDGATNQPNVFYDPLSVSSALPYFSKGRVDMLAQRSGLIATQQKWKDSPMVEQMFVWTWDARPFPYWPDLTSVWADGGNWRMGHWVQGKLGTSSLAAILTDIGEKAGLTADDIDVGPITQQLAGYIISGPQTYRDAIETLQAAYFFDIAESDYKLKFMPRGGNSLLSLNESDLAVAEKKSGEAFGMTRTQELELPRRVSVVYLTRLNNYQTAIQYSQRDITASLETRTIDLPIVLDDQTAKNIADVSLFTHWMGRTGYQFALPVRYARLDPADVIQVTVGNVAHNMRILSTRFAMPNVMEIQAVAEDASTFDFYTAPSGSAGQLNGNVNVPATLLHILDMPALPGDDADKGIVRLAAGGIAEGWTGSAVYRSDDGGANYVRVTDANTPAVIGTAQTILEDGTTSVFDEVNSVTILLIGDSELQSISEIAVLNGGNAAMLGDELIQFKTAILLEPGKYQLSGLLRGRMGTEWATGSHVSGERFVLLDSRLGRMVMPNNVIGLSRPYKPVTFGSSLSDTVSQDFLYQGTALKPYSPVHIAGTRDGSGNLIVDWTRRTRLGGDWQDGIDVPLNESSEAYEIDIMDGTDVIRTISGLSSATASYSAAAQTSDFGSAQASIDVKVYQVSGIIGRGYGGEASI